MKLRLYGTKGGIEWSQRHANQLIRSPLGHDGQIVTRNGGKPTNSTSRRHASRAGHPEGRLEAFGNIYAQAAQAIIAMREGRFAAGAVIIPDCRRWRRWFGVHRRRHTVLDCLRYLDKVVRSDDHADPH